MLLDGLISYLFFSSFFAFLVLLPGFPVFFNDKKKRLQNARKQEMNRQFLEGIQMTAASLAAGYSIENAVKEAWKELSRIYPKDSFIIREFQILVHQTIDIRIAAVWSSCFWIWEIEAAWKISRASGRCFLRQGVQGEIFSR